MQFNHLAVDSLLMWYFLSTSFQSSNQSKCNSLVLSINKKERRVRGRYKWEIQANGHHTTLFGYAIFLRRFTICFRHGAHALSQHWTHSCESETQLRSFQPVAARHVTRQSLSMISAAYSQHCALVSSTILIYSQI